MYWSICISNVKKNVLFHKDNLHMCQHLEYVDMFLKQIPSFTHSEGSSRFHNAARWFRREVTCKIFFSFLCFYNMKNVEPIFFPPGSFLFWTTGIMATLWNNGSWFLVWFSGDGHFLWITCLCALAASAATKQIYKTLLGGFGFCYLLLSWAFFGSRVCRSILKC